MQLLLDEARYERVTQEAERTGRSVAAVIRAAIDAHYPTGDEERSAAARDLLESSEIPEDLPGEGPGEYKAAYDDYLAGKLGAT